jgi:hypothetical protein
VLLLANGRIDPLGVQESVADPLSAKAWLEGKLFVGLLIEHPVDAASSFSPGATLWQQRRSRWREVEFIYRQLRAGLLLPHSLATVLRRWHSISRLLADTLRKRKRHSTSRHP